MTAYELHDGDRGRVLPAPATDRTTITAWAAKCALDADLRTKSTLHREIAARLTITKKDTT